MPPEEQSTNPWATEKTATPGVREIGDSIDKNRRQGIGGRCPSQQTQRTPPSECDRRVRFEESDSREY